MSDSSVDASDFASGSSDNGFCERFNQLINELGISQNEFARQIGSTSAFISNLSRGKSQPGQAFLHKIATTFGVSLDWLVLGKGTLRGEQFLDPEWHRTVMLRVALAQLVAEGNSEALTLAKELLGEQTPVQSISHERQALFDELATQTKHGSLITMLYNRYLPITDANQRGKDVLQYAIRQLQSSKSDPLAAMLDQNTQNAFTTNIKTQIQHGDNSRMAGRNYNEK